MLTFLGSCFKSFRDALARQIGETCANWVIGAGILLLSGSASWLGIKDYLADNSSSNTSSNAPAPTYTVNANSYNHPNTSAIIYIGSY